MIIESFETQHAVKSINEVEVQKLSYLLYQRYPEETTAFIEFVKILTYDILYHNKALLAEKLFNEEF